MAITVEELNAYKQEKQTAIDALAAEKVKAIEEAEAKAEANRQNLIGAVNREYELEEAKLTAEISAVDNLIAKNQEEVL